MPEWSKGEKMIKMQNDSKHEKKSKLFWCVKKVHNRSDMLHCENLPVQDILLLFWQNNHRQQKIQQRKRNQVRVFKSFTTTQVGSVS